MVSHQPHRSLTHLCGKPAELGYGRKLMLNGAFEIRRAVQDASPIDFSSSRSQLDSYEFLCHIRSELWFSVRIIRKDDLEAFLTVVIGLCAIVATMILVRREFFASSGVPTEEPRTREVSTWRTFAAGRKTIGADAAPVTLTVFSDFQCPFCAAFAATQRVVLSRFSTKVRIVFRNSPITSIHPASRDAALFVECAAAESLFGAAHDSLFAHRDSLGSLAWESLARRVGLRRPDSVVACMRSRTTNALYEADSVASERISIVGTPTILVNSLRMRTGAPSDSAISQLIEEEISRKR